MFQHYPAISESRPCGTVSDAPRAVLGRPRFGSSTLGLVGFTTAEQHSYAETLGPALWRPKLSAAAVRHIADVRGPSADRQQTAITCHGAEWLQRQVNVLSGRWQLHPSRAAWNPEPSVPVDRPESGVVA